MAGSEKILVVRVGRAGDLVMVTPALDSLLAALPGAEIHLLTTAEGARVLRGFDPRLTRTWLYKRRFPRALWLRPRLRRRFLAEGYARAYVFETHPHYRRWLAGVARETFGLGPAVPGVHYAERCLLAVEGSLASPPPRGQARLPVSEAGVAKARALLAAHGIVEGTTLVGLHATFSGSLWPALRDRRGLKHRHWPRESFARLGRLLAERARAEGLPLAVVVDALPAERAFVEPLVAATGGAITLLSAPPDFERYKGLLRCLDVLVAPNTGPMHMAAAVGTRVVALFSGWDTADCGPYAEPDRVAIVSAADAPDPERGLAAITPERAADAVFRLLDAAVGGK
ncbi:MAG: glycosyltransferase family 9 protein [Candidatus Krumholzibacteriota bacterium]|nr:glycosyltransferase family 9 protein [Candidatus Krumholzibacteriota bacterium]